MIEKEVLCSKNHKDCFANRDGQCIVLFDTVFPNKDCPFYKTSEQAEAEKEKCRERLRGMGREDLAAIV